MTIFYNISHEIKIIYIVYFSLNRIDVSWLIDPVNDIRLAKKYQKQQMVYNFLASNH